MFMRFLTGMPPTSRAVHGSLLLDNLKFSSISANSFLSTQESPNIIKRFTGRSSISSNETKGPHGFTGSRVWKVKAPLVAPKSDEGGPFKVQGSGFDVRCSMFPF